MIERHFSASRVNEIVNDPSIYPWVCGPLTEPIDLTEPIESGNYIALIGEHGGFLFWKVSDGIFDAHSIVLPSGRGRWAIRAAKEALRLMFNDGAQEVMMAAPKGNLAVLSLIRILKAKYRGIVEEGWWQDGRPIAVDVYSMTKTDFEKCL